MMLKMTILMWILATVVYVETLNGLLDAFVC